ncbi:MAG: hypothetical protein E6K81_10890 [Candidatus Eisenbacteria bacterium]|uniref:Uncharacterized protein n=1 Tax=Eiseniibacteriota bacterium TaxID=2212470 RepID=A0A538U5F8_UNCEI|nr:MAG: hypothetical protein E6K81_10890 [Candidatus Eisenbacteria bacterium]
MCFAWVALGLLILAINVTPITNNDIFLHLKTGELILETGQVPVVDDYSALARGRPFAAHEWLAGVLFAIFSSSAPSPWRSAPRSIVPPGRKGRCRRSPSPASRS